MGSGEGQSTDSRLYRPSVRSAGIQAVRQRARVDCQSTIARSAGFQLSPRSAVD